MSRDIFFLFFSDCAVNHFCSLSLPWRLNNSINWIWNRAWAWDRKKRGASKRYIWVDDWTWTTGPTMDPTRLTSCSKRVLVPERYRWITPSAFSRDALQSHHDHREMPKEIGGETSRGATSRRRRRTTTRRWGRARGPRGGAGRGRGGGPSRRQLWMLGGFRSSWVSLTEGEAADTQCFMTRT